MICARFKIIKKNNPLTHQAVKQIQKWSLIKDKNNNKIKKNMYLEIKKFQNKMNFIIYKTV